MLVSFIDFKKAYDGVGRRKLWGCLKKLRIGGWALAFLKAAYSDVSCEVKVGAGRSDPFEVSCGLRQGCILSLLLLSLFINSVVERLKEVWGCGRQLKPIEEVQMRAMRIFMGVGRLQSLASLQFEMNMLPVKWEPMKTSIEFWVHVMRLGEGRLLMEVVRKAMKFGCRVQ